MGRDSSSVNHLVLVDPPSTSPSTCAAVGTDGLRTRVCELEASNRALRREVEAEAAKLEALMCELCRAARQVGEEPLARALQQASAWQADLSSAAACSLLGEPLCSAHHAPHCARCRALAAAAPRLSAREREVLRLLTGGSRSPCIADELGICIATVEVHRRNIMRKLGLHCVADLTRYAVRQGLTSL